MTEKCEQFIASYLRLNGYFTVPNFIPHNPLRMSGTIVGNHTETDILGVRMPFSEEIVGPMRIENHSALVDGADGKFDVVIGEVKTGQQCKPNPVWKTGAVPVIDYILKFVGLLEETKRRMVAESLASNFCYDDGQCRVRYIIFSQKMSDHYSEKGVTYIGLRETLRFLVDTRGSCWNRSGIGSASLHGQWNKVLKKAFDIAAEDGTVEDRIDKIERYLINRNDELDGPWS